MVATDTRRKAREALAGKWGKAVVITLLQTIILGVINFIVMRFKEGTAMRSLLQIVETIITLPISVGIVFSFIKLKRDEEVESTDFLSLGFGNFVRAWKIALWTFVKMIIPMVVIIAGLILFGVMMGLSATGSLFGNPEVGVGLLVLGIVIYVAAIVYAVVIGLLYSLSYMIAYDNPDMTAKDVVNESARLMKGHRGDLFVLQLSFIGWAILCVFTFGIGFLWLIPYIQTSVVCFYDEILNLNKDKSVKTEENGPVENL